MAPATYMSVHSKTAFNSDFDELMRSESNNYDDGLTVTDEVTNEEKTYKNGKVITIKKTT